MLLPTKIVAKKFYGIGPRLLIDKQKRRSLTQECYVRRYKWKERETSSRWVLGVESRVPIVSAHER